MNEFLHLLGTLAAIAGAVTAWAFVLIYRRPPFNWRRYEEGQHLMVFTLVLAVIFTYVSVRAVVGTTVLPLRDEIARFLIYGSIATLLVWRVHLLWRARS